MAAPVILLNKFKDICRLCLKHGNTMSSIFHINDNQENTHDLVQKIANLTLIQIEPHDKLPTSICGSCNDELERLHKFRMLVQASDKTLKYTLKSKRSIFDNSQMTTNTQSVDDGVTYTLLMSTAQGHYQIINVDNKNIKSIESPTEPNIPILVESTVVHDEVNLENLITTPDGNPADMGIFCELCLKSFDAIEALKEHISEHCSLEVKNPIPMKFIKIAPKIRPQICNEVDNLIEPRKERRINKLPKKSRKKSTGEKCRCDYCKKFFLNVNISSHVKKCCVKKCDFICSNCDKSFDTKNQLRHHRSTHTNCPLICDICLKKFNNRQSHQVHMKRHTIGARYNCNLCNKGYLLNCELQRHIQTHLEQKNYPCNLCDTTFPSRSELTRHLKYHYGTKRFTCDICSKNFYESGHLKVHIRFHTGERPYICELCNKGFVSNSKLVRHRKIHEKYVL